MLLTTTTTTTITITTTTTITNFTNLFHGRTRTDYLYRCVWSGIMGR